MVFSIVVFLFCAAGLFHFVENLGEPIGNPVWVYQLGRPLYFHEALYFTLVVRCCERRPDISLSVVLSMRYV